MSERPNFKKISIHEAPKQSPGFLLWHISTSWRSSIEAVLKIFGLTHPQFVILATTGWLTRNGELTTQAAIGKMAGLDPNTTSQIITSLEKRDSSKEKLHPMVAQRTLNLHLKGTNS
jgi:DNA-binding MarR family transcriptional regulator